MTPTLLLVVVSIQRVRGCSHRQFQQFVEQSVAFAVHEGVGAAGLGYSYPGQSGFLGVGRREEVTALDRVGGRSQKMTNAVFNGENLPTHHISSVVIFTATNVLLLQPQYQSVFTKKFFMYENRTLLINIHWTKVCGRDSLATFLLIGLSFKLFF